MLANLRLHVTNMESFRCEMNALVREVATMYKACYSDMEKEFEALEEVFHQKKATFLQKVVDEEQGKKLQFQVSSVEVW